MLNSHLLADPQVSIYDSFSVKHNSPPADLWTLHEQPFQTRKQPEMNKLPVTFEEEPLSTPLDSLVPSPEQTPDPAWDDMKVSKHQFFYLFIE